MTEPSSPSKTYLAMFLGTREAMEAWKKLPQSDRNAREKAGMSAWHQWVADHEGAIVQMGSPLGKTKRVDISGLSDARNEMGAWTVVKASSHEEAASLFLNHPHFAIFPGDRVEVMECLPIPAMT